MTLTHAIVTHSMIDEDLRHRKHEEPPGALPYIVALDRASRSVVVAVRGTWSLADCLTDIVAVPEPANQWLPPSLQQVRFSRLGSAVQGIRACSHGVSAGLNTSTVSVSSMYACSGSTLPEPTLDNGERLLLTQ